MSAPADHRRPALADGKRAAAARLRPPDRIGFENGKLVYYLNGAEVAPGTTLSILIGDSLGTIGIALTGSSSLPTCIPTSADH